MIIAFNKPYGVISQFTQSRAQHRTLSEFGFPKNVYPIGRLDLDSEGLLLLSDEAGLNERLLNPKHRHRRIYWAQIERVPTEAALKRLEHGIIVDGHKTLPCRAWIIDPQPVIPKRNPPIRFRKNIPTCWIALELFEGKNRQVRRMTAAINHPTLRLIRVQIGDYMLGDIEQGSWKILSPSEREKIMMR